MKPSWRRINAMPGRIPFKIGRCERCGTGGMKLISKKCFESPNFCYQKSQQERYREKQMNKPKKDTVKKEKGIPELLQLATIVFNKWIRERDSINGIFKCISCNEDKKLEEMQAGHYRPTTYSTLRFNEFNVWGECEQCNCHDPNHLVGYRKNLIEKIGPEEVNRLESVPLAKYYKWDRAYLLEIIKKYK